jgi:hypothetical protein
MFQKYEQGDKPPRPQVLTSSGSGSAVTITAGNGGKTISFTVQIKRPTGGNGPFPAIITVMNRKTIPIPAGVAEIILPVDAIALHSTRAKGVFYDLYGKNATASALVAWAWAVSRVIDVLEENKAIGIDPKRIGVSGCSRWGKGALVVGAFDDRIVLTIPQESGAGGDVCWRIAQALKNQGTNIETASNIASTAWVAPFFTQYSSPSAIGRQPMDHHELAGLVAPRALYSTGGNTDWMGKSSPFQCMTAAHKIYAALGVPLHHGFSQTPGHAHCAFPDAEVPELNAFIQKFLLGNGKADTNALSNKMGYRFDAKWAPWSVPRLT